MDRKHRWKKGTSALACLLALLMCLELPVQAAANASCKALYTAAAKECKTGVKKVTKQKNCTFLSYSLRKNVKDFYYATDSNQIYCVCIVKADSTSAAKDMLKEFNDSKKEKSASTYLSAAEKKQAKTTRCGRSGSYVWYLCLGTSTNNKNAEKALKKAL